MPKGTESGSLPMGRGQGSENKDLGILKLSRASGNWQGKLVYCACNNFPRHPRLTPVLSVHLLHSPALTSTASQVLWNSPHKGQGKRNTGASLQLGGKVAKFLELQRLEELTTQFCWEISAFQKNCLFPKSSLPFKLQGISVSIN